MNNFYDIHHSFMNSSDAEQNCFIRITNINWSRQWRRFKSSHMSTENWSFSWFWFHCWLSAFHTCQTTGQYWVRLLHLLIFLSFTRISVLNYLWSQQYIGIQYQFSDDIEMDVFEMINRVLANIQIMRPADVKDIHERRRYVHSTSYDPQRNEFILDTEHKWFFCEREIDLCKRVRMMQNAYKQKCKGTKEIKNIIWICCEWHSLFSHRKQ